MTPRPVPILALAIILAACGGAASPEPPATDLPATAPPASAIPGTPPAATPHGEQQIGGATSIQYDSIAQYAAFYDGVAIVRVVDISPLRWNTPSGERPSEADLHASISGTTQKVLVIGRVFTVELVREVRGAWPAPGQRAAWWVPGGRIGADEVISTGPNLREPAIGELAVAFTADQTYSSAIPLRYIGDLFPVDASGRVETFDDSETVTLDTLDQALP